MDTIDGNMDGYSGKRRQWMVRSVNTLTWFRVEIIVVVVSWRRFWWKIWIEGIYMCRGLVIEVVV